MKKLLSVFMIMSIVITTILILPLTAYATENSRSTAYTASLGTTQCAFGKDDSNMWYKFVAPESSCYEFWITNPYYDVEYQDYDTYITIYDANGNEVGFSGTDDFLEQVKEVVDCKAGSTYYLEISNYAWDEAYTLNLKICKHTHNLDKYISYAEVTEDSGNLYAYSGYYSYSCKDCDYYDYGTVPAVKSVKLSKTKYTYDGEAKNPKVTVKDENGNTLKSGTDYTVTKADGRKKVGKYTYKIKFKGKYTGTIKRSFTIVPKGTKLSKLTATTAGFKVTWKKQATQTTGYQIQYSTSSKFSKAKTVTVKKNSTTSKTIKKLKKGKKYYVRIRTYKTVDGTKYYSGWSASKSVTTKK